MKNLFILLILTTFIAACGAEEAAQETDETNAKTEEVSETDAVDGHPCDLLDLEEVSGILGLDNSKITAEKENIGNDVCMWNTTEISEEGEQTLVLHFDLMKSEDGFPNFENQITSMITSGTFEVPAGPDKGEQVPVKEVAGIGDKAAIYSASNYTTLIYHSGNQTRHTITLYRNVPDSPVFDGLNHTSEELEEKLTLIAKSIK